MFRLPDGWSRPARLNDFVLAAGIRIHRSGVAATSPTGEEVCGAAADRTRAATDRAWYELAERVCVVEASSAPRRRRKLYSAEGDVVGAINDAFPQSPSPRRWIPSRSNGVALHVDWPRACRRAYWELAERDRVLRSWMGEIVPRPIEVPMPSTSRRRYEWVAFSFPADGLSFSEGLEVVGVFAFPRKGRIPLAMGFAARPVLALALAAATTEALQQLAFLWGVRVGGPVDESLVNPDLHLDTYQTRAAHSRLRAWLDGEHRGYARARGRLRRPEPVRFVDLTGAWLGGKARVAKAICRDAVQLEFGRSPRMQHLPPDLRIHPIS
jgi:hypothetical protein